MADFDVTESSDQGALKFLCGDSSRSVTDEHMETFDSMEALLREMKHAPSIEMPEFDASNVSDWLSKVERSFRVRRYSDLDKLDLVAFSLEGDALLWFDSEMTRSPFHSWDEFRHRLFLRFAATPEASSETVTESLEARASYQVPVSSLEPDLSFSSEPLVVSEAWQSAMVSNNRVQSQFGVGCVKNKNNAHHVFDELFRMLHDPGGKKDEHSDDIFETEVDIGKVQRTQMDTVAESVLTAPDKVTSSSHAVAPSTDVITNRQNWDEACDAEIDALDGPATWIVVSLPANNIEEAVDIAQVTLLLQLILDDVKSHMRHKWKSKHLRAVYLHTNPSYALDVVNKPVTECTNDRVIATDLVSQAVLDQITKGLEMKKKMKVLKSWMFKYKPATSSSMLPLYVHQLGVSDIQDNDKEMVADPVTQAVLNLVTNAARFGLVSVLIWLTVLRVLWLLGTLFWSTSFKKQKFGKNWWYKFKHSLWQRECGRELLEVEVLVAETVVDVRLDEALWLPEAAIHVRFDAVGRRELLIKWRYRDPEASENYWMFSEAFVRLYPSFKLEDKLIFGEGSIDTTHQTYSRRNKEKRAVVARDDVAGELIQEKDLA